MAPGLLLLCYERSREDSAMFDYFIPTPDPETRVHPGTLEYMIGHNSNATIT